MIQNKEHSCEIKSSTVDSGPCGLPLSLREAQREVITLCPNRKPQQKRVMFLHVSEGDGDPRLTISDVKMLHTCLKDTKASLDQQTLKVRNSVRKFVRHPLMILSHSKLEEVNFSPPAPSLLTFDQSPEGSRHLRISQVRGGRPCPLSVKQG